MMSCILKTNCVSIVLLVVTCFDLTEQTRVQVPLKDNSRRNVDLDSAYDIALHLQHKLLKEFKHLKNQMASMQNDAAVDQDDYNLSKFNEDDTHRQLDSLDWFEKSSQSQLLRSKLEEHDSYLRMLSQLFKKQIESVSQRIENDLETQEELLKRIESRIDELNDTLVLGLAAHHEEMKATQEKTNELMKEMKATQEKTNELMKGIFDTVVAPRDCADIRASGRNTSGVYRVFPGNVAKRFEAEVLCDMDRDGNGWLVFQQRKTGNVSFERNWTDYANGFGELSEEFWLGNDLLHALTSNRNYKLRVELEDFDGQKRFAQYGNFAVRSSTDNYRLIVSSYSGDAGDGLSPQRNAQFSTVDADHDTHNSANCAKLFHGAWWYTACHSSNLNGQYLRGNHTSYADGVNWGAFRGNHHSLKTTRMKIAPVSP